MAHQAKADGTTAVRPTQEETNAACDALMERIHCESFNGDYSKIETANWILELALLNWEATVRQIRAWASYRVAEGFTEQLGLLDAQLVRKAALLKKKGGRK